MKFKAFLLSCFSLATLVTAQENSDVQAYAGLQFRLEDSFVELVSDEFFHVLPSVVNKVETLIP